MSKMNSILAQIFFSIFITGCSFSVFEKRKDEKIVELNAHYSDNGYYSIFYIDGHKFQILSKYPERFIYIKSKKLLIHNFGSGSGQVLNIDLYQVERNTLKKVKVDARKSDFYKQYCNLNSNFSDVLSFVFDRYSNSTVYFSVEDWSRTGSCRSAADLKFTVGV
jgi:hypothetical protein